MDAVEKWVHETFPPVVLTSSTPEVERLAQKNNLAFADLLNGFSMLKNADTPLRSVNHSYTLSTFNFRFISTSQFAALPLQDSMRLLNEVVMRHPPSPLGTGPGGSTGVIDLDMPPVKSVDDVPVFLRVIGAANNSEPLPWYRDFKRALMDTFRCEEYSMMCQPAAMLLVVSSTESNPRHSFEGLSSPQSLPAVFSQGLYDANLPKFYLVVHDVAETDGTTIDPEAILRNLQIPTHAGAVLYFNSLALDAATSANVQLWSKHPYVRAALFPDANSGNYPYLTEHLGGFLSSEDLGRMDAFVREFGLRFVLPALESRVFQLNEIVSAMKKGVKNVFKSWLRKPKDLSSRTQPNSNSTVTYRADSIEAQTRLLADTAFMVRDYDLALQMYRLVRDDYKSDKSLYHCANANEMIALCLLLTKGSPVQMTNALEAASAAYYKITNPATCRLAVRAAVIAGEIYVTLSNSGLFTDYMDNASAALIRGSTMEQGICSAVLMERAAMCDLQARVPKFRKFGFRMVMAGHVYDSLGHSAHSARCYALARAVYDNSGWFQVEDHINFTLAQQSNRLNDPMSSINLFLKLIGTGRNSASQQEALLYEFGMIVKEFLASGAAVGSGASRNGPVAVKNSGDHSSPNYLVVRDLCMPELDDKSTVVFAPVNAVGINRDIDGNDAESEAWKELEQLLEKQILVHKQATSLVPHGSSRDARGNFSASNRWLASVQTFNLPLRGRKGAGQKKPRQYALGEKIYVEFEMKNALSCAVDVENIHLYGEFALKGGDQKVLEIPIVGESDTRVIVDRVNLQLLPVSEERVRLAVTPMVPGTLRITGVRWSICGGDVIGEHAFNIPGPLLQDTRANKEARARAPNTTLIADVVGEMPWLGVKIDPVRDVSENYIGELMQFNVALRNVGSSKLVNLQLCCTDLSVCISSRDNGDELASYIGSSGEAVDLSHLSLEPGEQRQVILWARAHRAGRQQPRLLFKYKRHEEGEDLDRAVSRCVKLKLELNVLPCVTIACSVEPSFSNCGEYVLGVTATNAKPRRQHAGLLDLVTFETITCVSKSWRIVPFSVASESQQHRGASRLDAQETSTSYFRVIPRDTSKFEEDDGFSSVALCEHSSQSLPYEQMLCLDYAHDVVRSAEALTGDASGGGGDRGPSGGGIRSIQSVRRENKALKGSGETSSADDQQVPEPDPQPTTKEALLNAQHVDAHLIVAWSTPRVSGDVAIGQTNLTNIKVRSQPKPSSCPLTITLCYDDTVALQPARDSPMASGEVEVLMTVRNNAALSARPIDFTLEMLHPEIAAAKTALSSPLAPAPHFFWAGLTKKHVTNFTPGNQVEFKLRACFMRAGVYDLNRFRFLVSSSSGESPQSTPIEYVFPVEYLVYVHPAGVWDQGKLQVDMASSSVGTEVK